MKQHLFDVIFIPMLPRRSVTISFCYISGGRRCYWSALGVVLSTINLLLPSFALSLIFLLMLQCKVVPLQGQGKVLPFNLSPSAFLTVYLLLLLSSSWACMLSLLRWERCLFKKALPSAASHLLPIPFFAQMRRLAEPLCEIPLCLHVSSFNIYSHIYLLLLRLRG